MSGQGNQRLRKRVIATLVGSLLLTLIFWSGLCLRPGNLQEGVVVNPLSKSEQAHLLYHSPAVTIRCGLFFKGDVVYQPLPEVKEMVWNFSELICYYGGLYDSKWVSCFRARTSWMHRVVLVGLVSCWFALTLSALTGVASFAFWLSSRYLRGSWNLLVGWCSVTTAYDGRARTGVPALLDPNLSEQERQLYVMEMQKLQNGAPKNKVLNQSFSTKAPLPHVASTGKSPKTGYITAEGGGESYLLGTCCWLEIWCGGKARQYVGTDFHICEVGMQYINMGCEILMRGPVLVGGVKITEDIELAVPQKCKLCNQETCTVHHIDAALLEINVGKIGATGMTKEQAYYGMPPPNCPVMIYTSNGHGDTYVSATQVTPRKTEPWLLEYADATVNTEPGFSGSVLVWHRRGLPRVVVGFHKGDWHGKSVATCVSTLSAAMAAECVPRKDAMPVTIKVGADHSPFRLAEKDYHITNDIDEPEAYAVVGDNTYWFKGNTIGRAWSKKEEKALKKANAWVSESERLDPENHASSAAPATRAEKKKYTKAEREAYKKGGKGAEQTQAPQNHTLVPVDLVRENERLKLELYEMMKAEKERKAKSHENWLKNQVRNPSPIVVEQAAARAGEIRVLTPILQQTAARVEQNPNELASRTSPLSGSQQSVLLPVQGQ